MATYRQVYTSFWQDDFILTLSPTEKYFYLYLMTNSKTNICGIYELPRAIAVLETGLQLQKINELLKKFEYSYNKIACSKITNEICILNWKKYNENKSPFVKTAIDSALLLVKDRELIDYRDGVKTVSTQCIDHIDTRVSVSLEDSLCILKETKAIKDKETKEQYGEYNHVLLTEKQFKKLHIDYENADELIKFFDEYLEEKKTYKSDNHNLAIRRWVVDAVIERNAKKKNGTDKQRDPKQAIGKEIGQVF